MAKIPVCRFEDCPKKDSLDNPLVNIEEYQEAWLMRCKYCGRYRIVTKDKVGGTMGAGRKADGTSASVGYGRKEDTAVPRWARFPREEL